jgi:hypothetical protein
MGEPGRGRAPAQLKHLRTFFEQLPFQELEPRNQLVTRGYCLAKPGSTYVVYLPDGGDCELNLWGGGSGPYQITWYDPRTGQTREGGRLESRGRRKLGPPPFAGDVVAHLTPVQATP